MFVIMGIFVTISPTHANAGLPMLVLIWPLFWLAFIPIVLIESWVLYKFFKKEPFKNLLWPTTVANSFSTLVGIPLMWGILVALEMLTPGGGGTYPNLSVFWQFFLGVTLQAPWLLPYESEAYWMVPVSIMVLLFWFFFVSAWSEGLILAKFLKKTHPADLIKKATWKANMASYAFLYLIVFLFLVYNLIKHSFSKGGISP
jgi:hypothetical protein